MTWINKIFMICVIILQGIAEVTNSTYETVNVVLFVFILPVILIGLVIISTNCLLVH